MMKMILVMEVKTYIKGGDWEVPNWSPIISGLKWIYDIKKSN